MRIFRCGSIANFAYKSQMGISEWVCKVFVTGRFFRVSPPDSEALFGRGDLAPTMSGVVFSHSEANFDKTFTHPSETVSLILRFTRVLRRLYLLDRYR